MREVANKYLECLQNPAFLQDDDGSAGRLHLLNSKGLPEIKHMHDLRESRGHTRSQCPKAVTHHLAEESQSDQRA